MEKQLIKTLAEYIFWIIITFIIGILCLQSGFTAIAIFYFIASGIGLGLAIASLARGY